MAAWKHSSIAQRASSCNCRFAARLAECGVEFSVGASFAHLDVHAALAFLPAAAWTPAYQARKPRAAETDVQIEPRDGAWVAEATGCVDLTGWPPGTRLILRKERPHPGAQLRITDPDGLRITGFLTNTPPGGPHRQLADLELRHRRHARVEDRIRAAKDTGLRNLPFHDTDQSRIWLAISALAQDLLAWCARLALPPGAARYEPKRLRLRILAVAGRLVRTARRRVLHIDPAWPWAETITTRAHPSGPAPCTLNPISHRDYQDPGAPATRRAGEPACPNPDTKHPKIIKQAGRSQYGRYERSRLGARRRGDLEAGRRALLLAGVVNWIEAVSKLERGAFGRCPTAPNVPLSGKRFT